MVASNWMKFRLLLWKNWIIQKRHRWQMTLEFVIPLLCLSVLILLRCLVKVVDYPNSLRFTPVSIDSLDPLRESEAIKHQNPIDFRIAYSPSKSPVLVELLTDVANTLNLSSIVPLDSIDPVETALNQFIVAVIFNPGEDYTKLPQRLQYALRFPAELRTVGYNPLLYNWQTDKSVPRTNEPGARVPRDADGGRPPGYAREGFLAVQNAIARQFIRMHSSSGAEVPTVQVQRFPYPPYRYDLLLTGLEEVVAVIVVLSFIYPCINTIKTIALEKERQLKEAMQIMGLPGHLHWAGWFVRTIIYTTITISLVVVVLKVSWAGGNNVAVLTYTSWTLLWCFLFIYSISMITFCFMMSVFFAKATLAAAVGGLFWFAFYLIYLFVKDSNLKCYQVMLLSLFQNTGMAFGFMNMLRYESTSEGAQWDNVFQPFSTDTELTLGHVMVSLLVASILYFLIALYVEQIRPGNYGVPKPWYFPLKRTFWCWSSYNQEHNFDQISSRDYGNNRNFEETHPKRKAGIQIRHLKKVFPNGTIAVNSISLDMFEGDITVLLGHNGAGKTTTMSLLTGMINATSGTALVNGFDIRTNIAGVRGSVGLCPQHNILFDELTVAEHISFFCRVKGMDSNHEIEREVRKYLKMLELENKSDALARTLSGGMKRKLSVCIAFCGGSKVVFCDEPAAGMDPSARRALWDIFITEKIGRTVLLSTHFMDEADVLGDRIAIVKSGQVVCCGSPYFLKKRFGVGYNLVCTKNYNADTNGIELLLRHHLNEVTVKKNSMKEVSFQLSDAETHRFPAMFKDLDAQMTFLGILSYGVSVSTLEEVFIRVGSDNVTPSEIPASFVEGIGMGSQIGKMLEMPLQTGLRLYLSQTGALLRKRFILSKRSWFILLAQVLIPAVFVTITVLNSRSNRIVDNLPELSFSLDQYRQTVVVLQQHPPEASTEWQNNFADNYERLIQSSPGENSIESITLPMQSFMLNLTLSNPTEVNRLYLTGCEVLNDTHITAWFNNQPYHTAPLALNLVHNAIARTVLGQNYSIHVTNAPWEYTTATKLQLVAVLGKLGFLLGTNVTFAMSFVMAFYALTVVREQANRAKFLQLVSGANVFIYWTTMFIWDFMCFLITCVLLVAVLAAFQETGWRTPIELARIFFVLIAFGFATIPMTYLWARLFKVPTFAITILTIIYIISGLVLTIVVNSLHGFDFNSLADALNWIFSIFPHFVLNSCLTNIQSISQTNELCAIKCTNMPGCDEITKCTIFPECCGNDFFSFENPGLATPLCYMASIGMVTIAIGLMIDLKMFATIWYCIHDRYFKQSIPQSESAQDEDVSEEAFRVDAMRVSERLGYSLVSKNLSRMYGKFCSVNRLSFVVEPGDCFGLLGINGAGKTSTFRMISGDKKITDGEAFVQGISLRTHVNDVHRIIGYCPQFDALNEDLTCRETLDLFCRLRGVPGYHIRRNIDELAIELNFTKHLDKLVRQCSGGNRRKLSTAVAFLGSPVILFLDEPTTGMDPGAKRNLWDMVTARRRNMGTSFVLTSHSMDECEALCSRLAIMVNGEFKCLGSVQHLKSKFSQGYCLMVRLRHSGGVGVMNRQVVAVHRYVEEKFPNAVLKSEFNGLLTYHILSRRQPMRWSTMFGHMNEVKRRFDIEDYSLSQTSLEQVFLSFAAAQKDIRHK